MAQHSTACPACGRPASGRFCSSCGASHPLTCAGCGAVASAPTAFCRQCGHPMGHGGSRRDPKERVTWFAGGAASIAVVAGILFLVLRGPAAGPAPDGSAGVDQAAGAGTAPDISAMSPRERFDRLYNRVMQAAEAGEQATVTGFTPMALGAYQMLDTIDADARYHAAMLRLHTGDADGAGALADTILRNQPGHLFGLLIRGHLARWRNDARALAGTYADFLKRYDSEMTSGRREYGEHRAALEDFRLAAQVASGKERQGS